MKNLLKKVCKVYDLPIEDVVGNGRKPMQVSARLAFFLVAHLKGGDIHQLNMDMFKYSHTMPTYVLNKAIERFGSNGKFRARIKEILNNDDKFEQFADEISYQIAIAIEERDPVKSKKRNDYPRSECGAKLHSFNFSAEEEIGIIKACREAREYFEKYGKGHTPDKILMINKKRYQ